MDLLLSITPIIVIFILIFVFRRSAFQTGVLGLLITIMISIGCFQSELENIYNSVIKGFLISIIAAYVVFFGIFLFHLMKQANKVDEIGTIISECTSHKVVQLLIIVIGFSPLIESTSGFGTAFLIVTPIIISVGINPVKAILVGLVSLLSVPWGALSTGTIIGSHLSNIPTNIIGFGSAVIIFPTYLYFLVVITYIAFGKEHVKHNWKSLLLFSFTFGTVNILSNMFISVELSGVISSLSTLVLGIIFLILKKDFIMNTRHFIVSMSPYIILTIFIFFTRLIPQISTPLNRFLNIRISKYNFELPLLYSPGFWLFLTTIITIFIFKIPKIKVWESLKRTTKQWIPFLFSTTCFVAVAQLMVYTNMTNTIAHFISLTFGRYFIILSPILGGIGGFLTASNTGANAMFINLQTQIGQSTGLSPSLLAYAQNVSASHATMASPSRVMLGAEMYDVKEKENELLRKITFIVIGALFIVAVNLCFYAWIIN